MAIEWKIINVRSAWAVARISVFFFICFVVMILGGFVKSEC